MFIEADSIIGLAQGFESLFLSVQCDIRYMMTSVRKTIGFVLDPITERGTPTPALSKAFAQKQATDTRFPPVATVSYESFSVAHVRKSRSSNRCT
ncbi:hypothetical protein EMIT0P218_10847 [Pseudomonas sp. IT-P218]